MDPMIIREVEGKSSWLLRIVCNMYSPFKADTYKFDVHLYTVGINEMPAYESPNSCGVFAAVIVSAT